MKKLLGLFSAIILLACNQGKKPTTHEIKPQTRADSLMEDVMAGHDAAMAKYGKMQGIKARIGVLLDSISKLPGKAREAATPYANNLKEAETEVNTSLAAMDKWMEEFNMDSALNDMEKRVRYLGEEKLKIGNVRDEFLHAYNSADSLIRSKF